MKTRKLYVPIAISPFQALRPPINKIARKAKSIAKRIKGMKAAESFIALRLLRR